MIACRYGKIKNFPIDSSVRPKAAKYYWQLPEIKTEGMFVFLLGEGVRELNPKENSLTPNGAETRTFFEIDHEQIVYVRDHNDEFVQTSVLNAYSLISERNFSKNEIILRKEQVKKIILCQSVLYRDYFQFWVNVGKNSIDFPYIYQIETENNMYNVPYGEMQLFLQKLPKTEVITSVKLKGE